MEEEHKQKRTRKFILSKYTIYETNSRMYIVGSNQRETMFRVLEIDLTVDKHELSVVEDNVFFTRNEIMNILDGLEESNKDGLTKKLTGYGLLGFIRFTDVYYLVVVTKRSSVAVVGGHYLFHIDETELVPISNNYKKPDPQELRFLNTFQNLDLSKTFYFSYTYDITNTLQDNLTKQKPFNEMYVWNAALLKPIFSCIDTVYDWFMPIIHGFIDQVNVNVMGKNVYVTLIARRSHHFAGARFLKRGVNKSGNVANEVETEQMVSDMLQTGFNERWTSFVQHRGSIPLHWSQEASNLKAKPPIEINVVDPFYSAAALHFDGMIQKYGSSVQILNLIKQKERTPRESKLLKEFESCVTYLNQFGKHLDYTAWDMSRASKTRGNVVIEYLESYAKQTLQKTGIFRYGHSLQSGVCRTNCIDCLDRTNAAQFVIGKRALGFQLMSLGIVDSTFLEYDSDLVDTLTELFHDHGDTIALQYGGSHLVNTMETYRKINQWSSHSRDTIESIKRFYSNSFVDAQRQDAINLFLGNYVWKQGQPMLWDMDTDYYLHNVNSSGLKRSYTKWWTEKLSQELQDPPEMEAYWNEYYTPRRLTSISMLFEYNMNSTVRYSKQGSPFVSSKSTSMNHFLAKMEKKTSFLNSNGPDTKESEEDMDIVIAKQQLSTLVQEQQTTVTQIKEFKLQHHLNAFFAYELDEVLKDTPVVPQPVLYGTPVALQIVDDSNPDIEVPKVSVADRSFYESVCNAQSLVSQW